MAAVYVDCFGGCCFDQESSSKTKASSIWLLWDNNSRKARKAELSRCVFVSREKIQRFIATPSESDLIEEVAREQNFALRLRFDPIRSAPIQSGLATTHSNLIWAAAIVVVAIVELSLSFKQQLAAQWNNNNKVIAQCATNSLFMFRQVYCPNWATATAAAAAAVDG